MRLLHYLELRNFKRFGDRQRIELDHPAVLIGPNNCGKTTAIQAIALWSQAVKAWFDAKGTSPPRQRTATSLNRLGILSVPVQRARYLWHNAEVRNANRNIPLQITAGISYEYTVEPVTMSFRSQGDDLIYCTPDEATLARPAVIEAAAGLDVRLLYPMSGLETEEPILQPGRIDVLLGQGQTAQVLRNLCLMVHKGAIEDWRRIVALIQRLFAVELGDPTETVRGSIDLFFRQPGVRLPLDIALAGRGLQQMLLIFAYLHAHRRSVFLVDEPDAHLEILRQKQVYVLLRELAEQTESQVVMVTHSEVILEEALDRNLTLLLGGEADELASRTDVRSALEHYGADHYIRARQHGYVLYVEGGTDVDILRAFAQRLGHPVAEVRDERINTFYLRNNHANQDMEAEIERVEGGFGVPAREHFFALRSMLPDLRGLAIRDSDEGPRVDARQGGLEIVYWQRYEIENYVVTPGVLLAHVERAYADSPLFDQIGPEAEEVLHTLILERLFQGSERDLATWRSLPGDAARLLWEARTERLKLGTFAETFFRRLAQRLGHPMLLRKGELHRLVQLVEPASISHEVAAKLDLLHALLEGACPSRETIAD